MVDSKQFINQSRFVSTQLVKEWKADERNLVVTGEGEPHTFKDGSMKLQIPVTRLFDSSQMVWTLSQTAIEDIAKELGTYDTRRWIGKVLKPIVKPAGNGHDTLSATVLYDLIDNPEKVLEKK